MSHCYHSNKSTGIYKKTYSLVYNEVLNYKSGDKIYIKKIVDKLDINEHFIVPCLHDVSINTNLIYFKKYNTRRFMYRK